MRGQRPASTDCSLSVGDGELQRAWAEVDPHWRPRSRRDVPAPVLKVVQARLRHALANLPPDVEFAPKQVLVRYDTLARYFGHKHGQSVQTMTKSLATLNHVLETMDDVVVAKRGAQLRCHVSDADLEDLRRQGVLYHA